MGDPKSAAQNRSPGPQPCNPAPSPRTRHWPSKVNRRINSGYRKHGRDDYDLVIVGLLK